MNGNPAAAFLGGGMFQNQGSGGQSGPFGPTA